MKLNVLLAKLEQGASQFKALLRDYTTFFKKELKTPTNLVLTL